MSDNEFEELEAKRKALEEKLAKHASSQSKTDEAPKKDNTGFARGLKIASEFVGGVVVGAAIGYGIDHFAGTLPLFFVIFLMLGFAAGILNVLRAEGMMPKN